MLQYNISCALVTPISFFLYFYLLFKNTLEHAALPILSVVLVGDFNENILSSILSRCNFYVMHTHGLENVIEIQP